MNTENLLKSLEEYVFTVWYGTDGYDTRPFVVGGEPLPIAYDVGYAYPYMESYSVKAGDIQGALDALPEGTLVVIPDQYEKYNQYVWVKAQGNWVFKEYVWVKAQGNWVFKEYID